MLYFNLHIISACSTLNNRFLLAKFCAKVRQVCLCHAGKYSKYTRHHIPCHSPYTKIWWQKYLDIYSVRTEERCTCDHNELYWLKFHRVEKMTYMRDIVSTSFLSTLRMNSSEKFSTQQPHQGAAQPICLSTGALRGVTTQTSTGCQCTLDVWGQLGLPRTRAIFCPEEQAIPGKASGNCPVQHP